MEISQGFEFPPKLAKLYRKAVRIQWISFFYMSSVVLFLYLVMGQSQTMKVVWFEDMLSLIPPLSLIVSSKLILKPATKKFPYGYHQVTGIAFLASALALTFVGLSLLIDSSYSLYSAKHPIFQ